MKTIYFIRPVGQIGPVKIGFSTYPKGRLVTYQAWSPVPLEIVAQIEVPGDEKARHRKCALLIEQRFHAKFKDHRLHHEWFAANDDLTETITAIQQGRFDVESLPKLPREIAA